MLSEIKTVLGVNELLSIGRLQYRRLSSRWSHFNKNIVELQYLIKSSVGCFCTKCCFHREENVGGCYWKFLQSETYV